MKRGAWHQFGDRSQLLALEQLEQGNGVGVVLSPRDLSRDRAVEMAPRYKNAKADIMIDLQFHLPDSLAGKIVSYEELAPFRQSITKLHRLPIAQAAALQAAIEKLSKDVQATAVLAPAVVYEAGRPDIVSLNEKLFFLTKAVGDSIGIPTIATLVVGASASGSETTMESTLADATAISPDGWYFAFESAESRIPSSHDYILRLCKAGLTLACSGLPIFHAFAGPVSLLSPAFGATATGIGHSQNLWQFTRERWQQAEGGGGGGDAPPRLFSSSLWGTLVYADEYALVSDGIRKEILTVSPFSAPITTSPPYLPWGRWEANKHLVHMLVERASAALSELDAEKSANGAIAILERAVALHAKIASEGIQLADGTNKYQNSWRAALVGLKASCPDKYEYLRMVRGL